MAHRENDPSSSCAIKPEPEGEGIYASTACSDSRDTKTGQGLTLPPKIQSSDSWQFSAARSTIDDEIDALFGFGQAHLLENESGRNSSWLPTLFEDEYQLSEPPRKKRRLTELPVPDPSQGAKSTSQTPSVRAPHSRENNAKAPQQPAQSDCLASISQTSARSETAEIPSGLMHEVAPPDSCNGGDQGQVFSRGDELQHTLAADARVQSLHAEENHAGDTPAARQVAKRLKETSRVPSDFESDGEASRAKPAQRMKEWEADTPIPSIEIDLHQSRALMNSRQKPSLSVSQQSTNAKANSGGLRVTSSSSASVDAGWKCKQAAAHGKKSEYESQQKRANTAYKSSTPRLNCKTSKLFSTFMNLRKSLPISAIMAMLLPPQRRDLLQTLAELFNAQEWISRSGVTQSVTHELPGNLRAILDQIKSKFKGDEQFRKFMILYVAEDLKDTCEAKGTKRASMDDILQMGIDQLKTLDESKQQLLYERKHYHGLLVDMDGEISVQKERIQQLEAEIRFIRTHNPHLTSTSAIASTPSPPATPQLELENGVPKHNPFWVCRLMLLDGSCVQCHGMNQEWHQLFKPGRAGEWTRRTQCFRCGRRNKSNRTYLSDIEAKMFGGLTKTGRINPYGNQPQTSQQGSSRQTSSPAAQPPVINNPPSPVKNSTPVYMGSPPASMPQPAQQPVTISPTSPVKNPPPVAIAQSGQHPPIIFPASLVKNSTNAYVGNSSVNTQQPSVLQVIPYETRPTIFTGDSYESISPAKIATTQDLTATMSVLTFPAMAEDALTHPFQPVLPANIPKLNVGAATMGALTFPAATPEPRALPKPIDFPSSKIPDPEEVHFSQWMGIATIPGNGTINHIQAPQQIYGNSTDSILQRDQQLHANEQDNLLQAAAQRIYGNGTNNHQQTAQGVYYSDASNHLQATQQTFDNVISNQSVAVTQRTTTTPPTSDLPSPKKAKLHPGFNVTNSTQETLRLQLQGAQKSWMSPDFAQSKNDEEPSQSTNDSFFSEGDDAGSTLERPSSLFGGDDAVFASENLHSLFGDDEGSVALGFEDTAVDAGDSQYSGSNTIGRPNKSDYDMDCEFFGVKYTNERREKEAAKETAQLDDSHVDLDAQLEADLMAAFDAELGY